MSKTVIFKRKPVVFGVMGASAETLPESEKEKNRAQARDLGNAIVETSGVVITGETTGLPELVARTVHDKGGLTIGISPGDSEHDHTAHFPQPEIASDVVIYTGFGSKGRNVVNIRSSDIVIIFGGSIGTLNEFTIAFDEGKVIGVLKGSGGVADNIESIISLCNKETEAEVIFDEMPGSLVSRCYAAFQTRRSR